MQIMLIYFIYKYKIILKYTAFLNRYKDEAELLSWH